jgi:hypothetical protein
MTVDRCNGVQMLTEQVMIQPSSWIEGGIEMRKVRDRHLFKFTDELQSYLEELSDKQKEGQLSAREEAELAGILELDRIFTLINAKLIAES